MKRADLSVQNTRIRRRKADCLFRLSAYYEQDTTQISGAKRSWEGVAVGKDYFIASNALRNSFPVL
jgi:hypothetical protein